MSDLPICPECGEVVKEIWDNPAWDGWSGPRADEVIGFECHNCGKVDPILPNEN